MGQTVSAVSPALVRQCVQHLIETVGAEQVRHRATFLEFLEARDVPAAQRAGGASAEANQAWSELVRRRAEHEDKFARLRAQVFARDEALTARAERLDHKWRHQVRSSAFVRSQQAAQDVRDAERKLGDALAILRNRIEHVAQLGTRLQRRQGTERARLEATRTALDARRSVFTDELEAGWADRASELQTLQLRRESHARQVAIHEERYTEVQRLLALERDNYQVEVQAYRANTAALNERIAAYNRRSVESADAPDTSAAQIRAARTQLEVVGRDLARFAERLRTDRELVERETHRAEQSLAERAGQLRERTKALMRERQALEALVKRNDEALADEFSRHVDAARSELNGLEKRFDAARRALIRDYGERYENLYTSGSASLRGTSFSLTAESVNGVPLAQAIVFDATILGRSREASASAVAALGEVEAALDADAQSLALDSARQREAHQSLRAAHEAMLALDKKLAATWANASASYLAFLERFEHVRDDDVRNAARLFKARELLMRLELDLLVSVFEGRVHESTVTRFTGAAVGWGEALARAEVLRRMPVRAEFRSPTALIDALRRDAARFDQAGMHRVQREWLETAVSSGSFSSWRTAMRRLFSGTVRLDASDAALRAVLGRLLARSLPLRPVAPGAWSTDRVVASELYRLEANGRLAPISARAP
ncbi:MAG: hypothetical protein K0U93_21370 [Gammaproteobacteria bacterium]|nr:hypothetical protein [Gammaproteobacteria bacterium]